MSNNVRSEVLDCDWRTYNTPFLHYRISAARTIKIFTRVFNHECIWYVYNHF